MRTYSRRSRQVPSDLAESQMGQITRLVGVSI